MSTARSNAARVVVLLAVAAATTGAGPASAQTPLRLKFVAGETLRSEFVQKNAITIKAGDQETTNATELQIDLTWKVKSVGADGVAVLTLIVERARASIKAGAQTVKYDSKDPKASDDAAARALNSVYSAAVGRDYTLRIDARGRILEARVPDAVTDALKGSPFVAVADGGSVLSEKGLTNLLAQLIPVLPEKPAAKGDTWTTDLDLPVLPLRMAMVFTDKITAIDAATAAIDATIETTIKPEPNTPFTVTVKKQSGTGHYAIDTKAGRLTSSEIKQSLDLTLGFMNREILQSIVVEETMKAVP